MNSRFIFIFCLLLSYLNILAQLYDDFSDGNFDANPVWDGDKGAFEINSKGNLHLISQEADTSILSTFSSILRNTEWNFYAKQSFNSSSNNYSRVYLASDQEDLRASLNGYFVQIGGKDDNISLWRQDGLALTQLIKGNKANTAGSVNELRLKVICDKQGNWELFSTNEADANYISEGFAIDTTYVYSLCFGVFCKYTSSNSTKFYFDDFSVGTIFYDSLPPKIQSVEVLSSKHIRLYFNEVVDRKTSADLQNYWLDGGVGRPAVALRQGEDSSVVDLWFETELNYNTSYMLQVSGVQDRKGNRMPLFKHEVFWYIIQRGDVVINEIMADPSPEVGLPEFEYLELYNKSKVKVNLKNWVLRIGASEKMIPSGEIYPDSFILIGHQSGETALSAYASFVGLPSFSLRNSGTDMVLETDSGKLMHYVSYADNWYGDQVKEEGGWSLEQIDPDNYCGGMDNWGVSRAALGGSPGQRNSIFSENIDSSSPEIDRVVLRDRVSIEVCFSEVVDSVLALSYEQYSVSHNVGTPIKVESHYPEYNSFSLHFAEAFKEGVIYELFIGSGITDCAGNSTSSLMTAQFGIPQIPEKNDVLINEVLFNPKGEGVDFVELYNNSDKIIDLKHLRLASWDSEEEVYEQVKEISTDAYQIFPYQFYVLSSSSSKLRQQYYVENPLHLVEMKSLPSMSSTDGNIFLLAASLEEIDGMFYEEEMHYALLDNPEGVSLERINYQLSSLESSTWLSSAVPGRNSYGYGGTPTYENSQFSQRTSSGGDWSTYPEIFSPDNDGVDDFLQINYKLEQPGYTANIVIFDAKGRLVRNLVSSRLLEAEGQIVWDGFTDENTKALIGIYIIYVETYSLEGTINSYKLSAVLGGKL